MSWWQIALITFAPVVGLLLVGGLVVYVRTRIRKLPLLKRSKKREVVQEYVEPTISPEMLDEVENNHVQKLPLLKKGKKREVTQKYVEPTISPELLNEIENNHRIASESHNDELLPFQTNVWNDAKQHIPDSIATIREDLIEAYIDMGLANNIVWMLTDLGFGSQTLSEQYVNLCTKIAARLDRIISLLNGSGD